MSELENLKLQLETATQAAEFWKRQTNAMSQRNCALEEDLENALDKAASYIVATIIFAVLFLAVTAAVLL